MESASSTTGAPSWVIYDPLQHRYFQIGAETINILSLWEAGMEPSTLARLASQSFNITVGEQHVLQLLDFLRTSHLIVEEAGNWRQMADKAEKARGSIWSQLIHNYLFLRVPLVKPQRFLKAMLPLVAPFYTRTAGVIVVLVGLAGLYLTSRQWDSFVHTFQSFMSWEGAAIFAVTLVFTKALHELGHAFTAMRYGCQVPTMGVAFMIMVPMLYTDVTDAWRLRSRRQRFWIAAAGIVVELALAAFAMLAWAFLPEGAFRSAAFSMATTSLIMTLVVNLSPFMRFDGYYLLSDLLGVENLHARSFALGRWKLRRILFGTRAKPPEVLSPGLTNTLIVLAWVIWLYRLIVFTGIAVVVYHFFFKLLGLLLFAIEIWFFILRPVVHEIWDWRKLEAAGFSAVRTTLTASVTITAILLFVVPWSGRVEVPAVLESSDKAQIFPPKAALLKSVAVSLGQEVREGDVIAELETPALDHELETTAIKLAETRIRLGRVLVDQTDREEYLVLASELLVQQNKLDGLARERNELTLRAPASGRVLQIDSKLHPGRWLAKNDLIAIIGGELSAQVRGYVSEEDVSRIDIGTDGQFIPNDPSQRGIPIRVTELGQAGTPSVEILELASIYGGPVAVESDRQRGLVPIVAQFPVTLQPIEDIGTLNHAIAGRAVLTEKPESQMTRVFRQVMRVIIRESGF